jgi:hypothetical protein
MTLKARCVALLLLACVLGCSRPKPTLLFEDLQSYSTVAGVEAHLKVIPLRNGWVEDVDRKQAGGGKPAYEFITLVGPYQSYSVDGELTLTFYNDRLMSTSFKASCDNYITALKSHGIEMPPHVGAELKYDRGTKFRYDEQQTNCRFLWVDPVLEKEWLDYTKQH